LSKQRKTGTPPKYRENQYFHQLSDKGTLKPQKRLVGFKELIFVALKLSEIGQLGIYV
jgi:hypothetical protein